MSYVSISVESLSKRYLIGHREGRGDEYTALRDVISRQVYNFVRKAGDAVRGRQIVQGDQVEEFWALQDVSFEVGQGEVVGIIGRNGAGKSTLLKILSRITEPDRGRAKLIGRVSSLLEVGTGFHPELTGRENIFLSGAVLGMKKQEIRQKFDEIVAFSEMERFLDTPVKKYSSGMYVRLAFAVAAHLEPEILIVDEVLAVGDAEFQNRCLGKLNSVAQSDGRTVLFVSHNMGAIQQLCQRALLIQDGKLAGDGRPNEIVQKYMSTIGGANDIVLRVKKGESTGEAKIVEFKMRDWRSLDTEAVIFGTKLNMIMKVVFLRPVTHTFFGILIHAMSGDPILNLRSANEGLTIDHDVGSVTLEIALDQVNLYPGEYTLSLYIHDEIRNIDLDWIPHCSRLWVLPQTHDQRRLDPTWGKYFVPSTWTVHEE